MYRLSGNLNDKKLGWLGKNILFNKFKKFWHARQKSILILHFKNINYLSYHNLYICFIRCPHSTRHVQGLVICLYAQKHVSSIDLHRLTLISDQYYRHFVSTKEALSSLLHYCMVPGLCNCF
jgi:hypothetical protein